MAKGIIRLADKIKVKLIGLTTLQPLKETAGNRQVWWLEFDWNNRREERQHWTCWRDSVRLRVFQDRVVAQASQARLYNALI